MELIGFVVLYTCFILALIYIKTLSISVGALNENGKRLV